MTARGAGGGVGGGGGRGGEGRGRGGEELSNAELICQKPTKVSNARDGGIVVRPSSASRSFWRETSVDLTVRTYARRSRGTRK